MTAIQRRPNNVQKGIMLGWPYLPSRIRRTHDLRKIQGIVANGIEDQILQLINYSQQVLTQ